MAPDTVTAGGSIGARITALRDRWHTKNHPFYTEFLQGKFGLEPLGRQMAQHYQHVNRVMPSQGIAYYRAPPEARRAVIENLAEEDIRPYETHLSSRSEAPQNFVIRKTIRY